MDSSDYVRRKVAGESAENEAGSLARRSRLERWNPDEVRFDLTWDDIQIEQPIGFGGFSQVFRVQLVGNPERDYALKCLNPQTKLNTKSFKTGAVDLAIEGEILSRLHHENVIQLHGICGGGPLSAYMDSDRGYFIVLDLLEDTLASKLEKYRAIYHAGKSSSLSHSRTRASSSSTSSSTAKHMSQSAVLERVASVAMGVAKGMEYLHSQGVALRDLKPDNIGFDEHGTPKIFDLGFAREVHTIKSTEVAGSLRYMAPEVARGNGSELASDVYSFGVLLWEICTLDKPYKHITSRDDFMQTIVLEGWRHTTSKIPSNSLRKLIKECWQSDPNSRPSFTKIVKKLRVELTLFKSSTSTSETTTPPPNKGFGSTVNLKRTATWTAKRLSHGMSNSSLGVLRLGFKSNNSFGKNSDKTTSTSSETTDGSPKPQRNATFAPIGMTRTSSGATSPILTTMMSTSMSTKTMSTTSSTTTSLNKHSRLYHQLRQETIAEMPEQEQTAAAIPSSRSLRRALPSAPVMTSVNS